MSITLTTQLMSDKQFEKLCKFQAKRNCDNTFKHTVQWMTSHNIANIREHIEKFYDLGAHCDCELLFNVAGRWHDEKDAGITGPSFLDDGLIEWHERIDMALFDVYTANQYKPIPGWDPRALVERDHAIDTAINALKDRHIIVDVEDVLHELQSHGIHISRSYIASELDARCPVQRANFDICQTLPVQW